MAKKFGDAYIDVHARTARARAQLAALSKDGTRDLIDLNKAAELEGAERGSNRVRSLGDSSDGTRKKLSRLEVLARKLNNRFDRTTDSVRVMEKRFHKSFNPMHNLSERLSTSWARMDSTVRLVLGLILTSGGPAAAALSGASAAATSLAASLGYALAGFSAISVVLPGFLYGIGLAVAGFKDIETLAPKASAGLDQLKSAFRDVDVPAFMREWNQSLGGFFSTLADSLEGDTLAASLGGAFSKLTDAFTDVINGDVWAPFIDALEGPASNALGNLFSALEPIINGVLSFLTAAAPFAETLTAMFGQWATQWSEAFQAWTGSAEFTTFMENAISALQSVFGLLGAVQDFLGTVFAAGVGPGNELLDILTGIFDNWNAFLQTAEGQSALAEWFARGLEVMEALGPLLVGLGDAMNKLVTPDTTALMADLFETVGEFLPLLAEMLEVVSHLGILNLIADLFEVILKALEPVMPIMKELATDIFLALGDAISALAPILGVVAEMMGVMFEAFGPALTTLIGAFGAVMRSLAPVLQQIFDAITPLIPILADFLVGAITTLLPIIVDLAGKFGTIAATLITSLMPVIEALLPILMSLLPVFVQLVIAANPILNLFLNLMPVLLPIIDLLAQLVTWLLNLIAPVIEATAGFLAFLVQFIAVGKGVGKIVDEIGKFFGKLWKFFEDIFIRVFVWFDDLWKGFVKWGDDVGGAVSKLWTTVKNFFTSGINAVKNFVTGLWDDVSGFFTNARTTLGNKVKDIWTKIRTFFEDGIKVVREKVSGFIDKIKSFFTDLPGNIKTAFSSMADTISSPFKTAFNAVSRAWNNTVGKLSWSVPDWIPVLGGKSISAPKLPEFAAGGIVGGPITALVGEAGPEAIIPLNRPLSQVDPSVREISALLQGKNGMSRFGAGGVVSGGVTIAEGAITVVAAESNPALVAESVVDRIAIYAR